MRSKFISMLTVLGAVTVLALAANTVALATTGKAILAGKINTSTKMTSIVRTTPGTGVQIKTKSAANAPFAVNGKGKVVNLNVDKVDGLDGGTRAYNYIYPSPVTGSKTFTLNALPVGKYLVSYDVYMDELSSADDLRSNCYLWTGAGGTKYGAEDNDFETASNYPALAGTALMTTGTTSDLHLTCNVPGSATWSPSSQQPVRITAIPLAGVIAGSPAVARTGSDRSAK